MKHRTLLLSLGLIGVLGVITVRAQGDRVTLVEPGAPRVSVVVSQEVIDIDPDARGTDDDLRCLRWAADDLADYLGRIAGTTVRVSTAAIDGLLPVYVGCAPKAIPMTVKSEFEDAYLLDIRDRAITLQGESGRAVSVFTTSIWPTRPCPSRGRARGVSRSPVCMTGVYAMPRSSP